MRNTLSSILILFSLLLSLAAGEQNAVPAPESTRFPNIRASLADGFFVLAEQQARGVLRADPSDEEAREATLLLSHALWGQKRFTEMLKLLKGYNGDPGYVYWRARANFELRRYEAALKELDKGGDAMEQSRYAPAALRLKGHLQQQIGTLAEAESSFREFDEAFPQHPDYVENRFDLAEVLTLQKRVPEAMAIYSSISEEQDKEGAERARLKLAHVLYTQGAADSFDPARVLLNGLATNVQTRLAYRIDAFVDLAALEEKAQDEPASVAAMRAAIALSPDARQRVPLKLSLARMLLRDNNTAGALKLLEECRAEAPNETIATQLQLEKAGALLKAKRFEEADAAYQIYLDVADDPDGLAKAYFGKGLALWSMVPGRYAEAAVLLDRAVNELRSPILRAEALFKAGDAYYMAEKFEEAEKRYREYGVQFPDSPYVPNALYQEGLSLARLGKRPEALAVFQSVEQNFPTNPFAEQAALRSADVLWANRKWEEVLAKYTLIGQTYTNSPATQALSEFQRGIALYRLRQYPDAQKAFESVIGTYPESEYVPQATYLRGYSLVWQGKTDEGVAICQTFIEKYPDSEWTPEVVFWLAELYFNQGRYAAAEPLFLRIAADFKTHHLAPRAIFWAGRCAAEQSMYPEAVTRYSEIAKNYPTSDILPQTRFWQGDALTLLGEFSRAILSFDEIIKNFPESYLVNAAWGRMGDCQFTLAIDDPTRYAEAMKSFQAILDRPSAATALKLQAEYKIGRCLEKTNVPDKAFFRYMNVVYTFVNEGVERSPDAVVWFTKSAFDAAKLKERDKDWKAAVQVYERVAGANVPAKEEALKRIDKIKKDNWRLFQ
jgi:TolA-binding protein